MSYLLSKVAMEYGKNSQISRYEILSKIIWRKICL